MGPNRKQAVKLYNPDILKAYMEENKIDAIAAHSSRNFYYLTGFNSFNYLIEPEVYNFVLISNDSELDAQVTVPMSDRVELWDRPTWVEHKIYTGDFFIKNSPPLDGPNVEDSWDALFLAIRRNGLEKSRVGFELEFLSVNLYERLQKEFPEMTILNISPIIRNMRKVKTAEEIRRMEKVCQATDLAVNKGIRKAVPGMTEKELAAEIGSAMLQEGIDVLYVQVATAPAGGVGLPTDRKLQMGDLVRLDVSGIYKQYHSDIGRGFVLGKVSQEQAKHYDASYQALQNAINSIKIGEPISRIFDEGMKSVRESGLIEFERHHVGHGIGLQAHEYPYIKADVDEEIREGMVLAIEVPLYVKGLGGFAPEDIVVVGSTENKLLTTASPSLPTIF